MNHQPASEKRKPLKEEVFGWLQEGVLAGRYSAGEWLRQEEISRNLGVSMTPVREALDLLVASGIAERVAFRGVRVLHVSDPDILDSYEMRLLLEAAASHRAATVMTADALSGLKALLLEEQDQIRSKNLPRQREVSRALHAAVVSAAGNPLLHSMYLQVLRTFPDWMLYEHLYRHPELLAESVRQEHHEHELIVEALANADPARAVQTTVQHVLQRGRELEAYVGMAPDALHARERHILELIPDAISELGQPHKETA